MLSQAFLSFTQTGASYIFGMAFLLLGLWVLIARDEQERRTFRVALAAGASLFVAVAVWFTYVFSVPAVLLAPSILFGFNKQRVTLAIQTGFIIGLLALTTFGAAGYSVGVRSAISCAPASGRSPCSTRLLPRSF